MNKGKIKSIRLVTPLIALALAFLAPAGAVFAADKPITLTITEAGTVEAPGPEFTVKPNETVALQLSYTGKSLVKTKGRRFRQHLAQNNAHLVRRVR